jgi:hypothetical protein
MGNVPVDDRRGPRHLIIWHDYRDKMATSHPGRPTKEAAMREKLGLLPQPRGRHCNAERANVLRRRSLGLSASAAAVAIALVVALVGATHVGDATNRVAATSSPVLNSRLLNDPTMQVAIETARSYDPALAKVSNKELLDTAEQLTKDVTQSRIVADPSPGVHLDSLFVTHTGNTFWFPKDQVVLWAMAGTGAIIVALAYFGVAALTVVDYINGLIATFWGAVALQRCAWFTTSPISMGTYSC